MLHVSVSIVGRDATELQRILPGFAIRNLGPQNSAPDFSQVQVGQPTPYASNGAPVAGITIKLDGANLTDAGSTGSNLQIEARYKLLPYLYTAMEEGTRTGLPLLRPLFFEFPDATSDRYPIDIDLPASGEFMVGPDILVAAPPFPEEASDYDAELPSLGWYDFWTGKRVEETPPQAEAGGILPDAARIAQPSTLCIHQELASLPVFVRPGAIIPIQPLVQSTAQQPKGPLTLRVFPGDHCAGEIYQDDGSTFAYRQGDFIRMKVTCEISRNTGDLAIHIGPHEESYAAWWKEIAVEIDGLATKLPTVTINGKWTEVTTGDRRMSIQAPDQGGGMEIVVHP